MARPQSSIEAGDTQVIPLLTDIEEENLIPNIRTRQSGARSAYIPTAREARVIDEERRPNNTQKSEALKKAKKKKVMIITAIFAVLIIVVGCFSGYFISKIINNGKEEEFEIPNLLGKNFEEIRTEYEAKGITVHQTSAEYNAEYEEGQIMTQRPDAGTKTTDKNIYVEVSKGTKLVKVTNIEGKDIKVAKYELENTLGFIVEQEEEVSEDVAAGLVISQEYKDVERPYGSVIKLKVSSGDGKAKVVVPTVVGKTIADAKKTLEDLKLKVETEYGEDEAKLNGTVLAQSYPQNSVLKEGDLIKLTVNRRVINKTVTVTGIPEGTKQSEITVKVSVDGGVMNSTTFSYDDEKYELSFAIDGYEKVSYNVMVNGSLIKSGEENF